jgi:hypothetical protein
MHMTTRPAALALAAVSPLTGALRAARDLVAVVRVADVPAVAGTGSDK